MTTTAVAPRTNGATSLEKVLIGGDLKALSPEERIMYYKQTCDSLGLNPLTKPFEYITLNNKLTLYARKDCTDQLRQIHSVSIDKPEVEVIDNLIIVKVTARDKDGRTDSDLGVVTKGDMRNNANEIMKAVTKAKRRVTLSICGLGMLDETEVETIPNARHGEPEARPEPRSLPTPPAPAVATEEDERDMESRMADLNIAVKEEINRITNGEARAVQELLNGRVINQMDEKALTKFLDELSKK